MHTEISKQAGKTFVLPQQSLGSKQHEITFVSNSEYIHFRCENISQFQLLSFSYDANHFLPQGIPLLKR